MTGVGYKGVKSYPVMSQLRYFYHIIGCVLLLTLLVSYIIYSSIVSPDSERQSMTHQLGNSQLLTDPLSSVVKLKPEEKSDSQNEALNSLIKDIVNHGDPKCALNEEKLRRHLCSNPAEKSEELEIHDISIHAVVTECSGSKEVRNSRPWIIFFHGMAYTSANWHNINMLSLAANFGFNNVAIDLPGFGKSTGQKSFEPQAEFVTELAAKLQIEKFVLVSPSMSGQYSIPLLKTRNEKLVGFVAAAPVATEKLNDDDFATIETKTLILTGVRDASLGKTSNENLSKLKNSRSVMIADAGHPSYLDNPAVFMREMFSFLFCEVL